MGTNETLLVGIARELHGGTVSKLMRRDAPPGAPPLAIDFAPPYPRLSVVDAVARVTGCVLPEDLSTPAQRAALEALAEAQSVRCAQPLTAACLLDMRVGALFETRIGQPTFVME